MPSNSSKVSKTVKTKTNSRVAKSSKKVQSSKNAALEKAIRSNFVAVAVLVAAVFGSIAVGISSHPSASANNVASASSAPNLFLRQLNSKDLNVGSTASVALYANSGKEPVNTVQSAIQYPADKLEVVSVTTANYFTEEAATDLTTPGLIRLARAVAADKPAITGVKPVVVVEFKIIQKPDSSTKLGIDLLSSFLVRSTDNKNIL